MIVMTRSPIALQARRRRRSPLSRAPRKPIEFSRMIKRIADQQGVQAAAAWTQSVLRHQAQIDLAALRSAIASKNVANIEAVVAASKLQQTAGRALRQPFTAASQAAGTQGVAILKANGIAASFNAVHPNVVNFAREQAATMVVGIPAETKQVIAEVIALGAQHGLTVADQARAIREVVGLPPTWASAPVNLAQEIRAGEAAAATSRRLSASAKQRIRSAIANGTVTDAFVNEMTELYAASLINRRALNIARTETLRASHHGLTESWKQAQQQGVLPQTARRFWIVTPDDRLSPEHASIPGMNPNGRGMDEPFETTEGPYMFPPSRPNCRCSVGLLPNVAEDFDVTAGAEADEPLRSMVPDAESTHADPVRVPMGVARELGFDDPVTLQELAGSGIHVTDKGAGWQVTASTREHAVEFVRELEFRATSEWDMTPAVRSGFTKFSQRLRREWGLVSSPTRSMVPEAIIAPSAAVEIEAQALYESAYGVVPRNRVMWNQLTTEGAVRRRFLTQAEKNLAEAAPGRLPARVGRKAARPAFVEQPVPGGPVGDLPAPNVVSGSRIPSPEVHRTTVEALRELNVDPRVVQYDSKLGVSSRSKMPGGQKWRTVGEYKNGRITLDPTLRPEAIKRTVQHEAVHLKFDIAMKTDPAIRKYIEANFRGLWTDDGITPYSRSHWSQFMTQQARSPIRLANGQIPIWRMSLPVNETLAEMVGESVAGSARYQKLLKMVDDAYQRAKARGLVAPSARRSGLRSAIPEFEKPPLRDFTASEVKPAGARSGLTNHLDTVFEDNFRVAAGAEAEAVENYMSYHYTSINNSLRSGNVERYLTKAYSGDAALIAERLQDIKGLDAMMARMPQLGDTATVWRSVNNVEWLAPQGTSTLTVLEDAAKLVGTEFRDGGFVSTTTMRSSATGWSHLKRDGGTLIEIRLPKNTKGAWMQKVARDSQSQAIVKREYLLPRGARFKVVEARVEGGISSKSILHLVVEYIP